jgi:hypothetical protein
MDPFSITTSRPPPPERPFCVCSHPAASRSEPQCGGAVWGHCGNDGCELPVDFITSFGLKQVMAGSVIGVRI